MAPRRLRIPKTFSAVFVVAVAVTNAAFGCPFCGPPSITWSERLERADVVVLAQWVSGFEGDGKKAASTRFVSQQVVRGSKQLQKAFQQLQKNAKAASKNVVDHRETDSGDYAEIRTKGTSAKRGEIELAEFHPGRKGDLFLLTGNRNVEAKGETELILWDRPREVTEISFNYIVQAPTPDVPISKRLPFYLKFLEFPDPLISNDAFSEFGKAPYKDVAALSAKLSREKIRKWLVDEKTPKNRFGLYGLMLGLCGNESDQNWLADQINEKVKGFRFGLDGLIAGYLLLSGKSGIDWLDKNIIQSAEVTDGDSYAAMQALRFLWAYDKQRFESDRLKQSMRLLLPRPFLTELVIRDLARWKDWEVQDQLMKRYGTKGYDTPPIKRAIVHYMMASTKDRSRAKSDEDPRHVVRGKEYLETLQEKDPVIVKQAKRFLF